MKKISSTTTSLYIVEYNISYLKQFLIPVKSSLSNKSAKDDAIILNNIKAKRL